MRRGLAALAAAALIGGACGGESATGDAAPSGGPDIEITSPASGTRVKGNTVTLDLRVNGIAMVAADGDRSGKTGHLHAFIDRVPVAAGEAINKEPGIVHSTDNPLVLAGLTKGEHEISVVLGDGTHARIGSAEDSIDVIVEGPTLDATAPVAVAAGAPVRIDFKVTGVPRGHFHVFIDKPLPKPGDVIDTPADGSIVHTADKFVEIRNLAPGEHVLYVVLGDGHHVVMNPLVADKVTVTVQ